ncbi:hypothetical protein [Thalassolituus marinus]|jgi:hypothetical protein|uniref:Uncharacterized protein n=1 Tax=Thalassolituus marinus TaxID=671053 RepID=A0ABS7ZJY3_9GAMM|nr:hypothetical protein [Thalassolituus marinus]MCA6062022.1 hypothetical protein [Thalassolituus marinus]
MEFNRRNIALLQKIKRLAKEEQGCVIHYDSPTLEHDLRLLVKSGVSHELLQMIEDFLPSEEPSAAQVEVVRVYRGSAVLMDDASRTANRSQKIYRGQVVA